MKHSKYRNTGLLFELLTRQITADIISGTKSSKASSIMKEHFGKSSELFKENQLFNVVLESKFKDSDRAKHLIETTTKAYRKVINPKKLQMEKYQLIKTIKESFDISDFFKSRISNYKLLASIHNVLSEDYSDPAATSKSHYTLIEHMTRKVESKNSEKVSVLRKENKDLRALTYKILVERFNTKYNSLSKEQKEVLREYINNISNTNGLNEFIESKFKGIVYELKKMFPKIDDKVIRIKISECINLVDNVKVRGAKNTKNVLKLMRFYQLLEDVRYAIRKA
tara:strand:+ start:237 stop:1082 length:846 start_codon:yes stop_codon:yes gene_type:complete